MALSPTGFDIWLAKELAGLLGLSPFFDRAVQSAIRHNVLGGFWFGAALFVFWIQSARKGQPEIQLRILTILVGSAIAIILTLLAGAVISWPPPCSHPDLAKIYSAYFDTNPNTNCFPSQSTALYASVAAGIYSIHKLTGWVLWIMVVACVALPRMYVGGHYLTDVIAGLLLASVGYIIARRLLEEHLISKVQSFFDKTTALHFVRELLIFVWILQVALEFRDVIWTKAVLEAIL